mgnify:CR=1 FL=1
MEINPFDDTYFMTEALKEAQKAYDKDEVPVGAVIVCKNQIIARSHNFSETLKLLRIRGKAMQDAVPKGEGGMIAILGSTTELIEKIQKGWVDFDVTLADGEYLMNGLVRSSKRE